MTKYKCNYCSKEYSNRQNLYRHKKTCKFNSDEYKNKQICNNQNMHHCMASPCLDLHQNAPNDYANCTKMLQNGANADTNSPNLLQSSSSVNGTTTELHHNEPNTLAPTNSELDDYTDLVCKYCSSKFTRKYSLNRHLNRCKEKKRIEEEDAIVNARVNEEVERLKVEMLDILNKKFKVHHKTFEKMKRELAKVNNATSNNNQLHIENQNNIESQNNTNTNNSNNINNSNNTNNIQNIKQNNIQNNINVNIIPLGKEDFVNTLSKETQLEIINKSHGGIKYFIDKTHFNPETPQYRSFAITNTQNNVAHVYDEEIKGYKATTKDYLMFNLFHERGCDIRDMIELHKDTLKDITVKHVNGCIDKLDTDKTFAKKHESELKVHIYNNTRDIDLHNINPVLNNYLKHD
jgi:DNA-directed RNA polymerase subunit RPC12/RpoP